MPATVEQVVPLAVGDAMNINLVVDQSGSMRARSKMDNAKKAASSFVDEMVKTQGNVAEITSFNDYVYNRQPFTSSAALLNSAIDAVSPTGETALYDALYWALQRTNLKSGSRVVIAFTDGEENSSNCSLNDVITLSQQTGIPVYIVGVGGDVNRSSLQSLASSCNGAYYDAASDDLAQALRQIYQSIYDDQRSMCRVVFTSTCPGSTSATRTVLLSCSDSGPFAGQISHTYVPVTSISSYDTSVSSQDYVLPGSASKCYSRSELEKMSLWELYLARNEIFARHGRGFKNQDLTDYFATKRWYTQTYTPEEFDAISSSQLNDYELKNVQTMYEDSSKAAIPRIWRRRSRLARNRPEMKQGPRFAPRALLLLGLLFGPCRALRVHPGADAVAHAQLVADALAGGLVLVADGRLHGGHHDVGHVFAHFAGEVEHARERLVAEAAAHDGGVLVRHWGCSG